VGGTAPESDFDSAFAPLFHDAFDVAYRLLDDVDDAEDAALDAMTQAGLRWEKIGQLPHRDAWVIRAAANAAISKARSRREPARPELGDESAVLRSAVLQALVRLPRRQRDVLALRYVAGLDEETVAGCLGISVDSVKKHMLHATTRLGDRVGHPHDKGQALAS
jgi:RNA polymerase sigma factor (sigma-70 family)